MKLSDNMLIALSDHLCDSLAYQLFLRFATGHTGDVISQILKQ